jgi:hypothetical protein
MTTKEEQDHNFVRLEFRFYMPFCEGRGTYFAKAKLFVTYEINLFRFEPLFLLPARNTKDLILSVSLSNNRSCKIFFHTCWISLFFTLLRR